MATLHNLLEFVPENDEEHAIFDNCKKDVLNEYLKDTNSSWSKLEGTGKLRSPETGL